MILQKFLKRWSELESNWCKPDASGQFEYFSVNTGRDCWDTIWLVNDQKTYNHDLNIVQGALQQAISWSCWTMMLNNDSDRSKWTAQVSYGDGEQSFKAEAREPAIALLDAYLQALAFQLGVSPD